MNSLLDRSFFGKGHLVVLRTYSWLCTSGSFLMALGLTGIDHPTYCSSPFFISTFCLSFVSILRSSLFVVVNIFLIDMCLPNGNLFFNFTASWY